jgi:hypothetical protein
LEGPIDIADWNPEEQEQQENPSTQHPQHKVQFLVVAIGKDKILIGRQQGEEPSVCQLNLAPFVSIGFARPHQILMGLIVPPGHNRVINIRSFLAIVNRDHLCSALLRGEFRGVAFVDLPHGLASFVQNLGGEDDLVVEIGC